jgi:flagellar motor switch protein FliG
MPESGTEKISGSERAAILLLSLGEQSAAEILRYLEPREVQKLGMTMAGLDKVSRESVAGIIGEFVNSVDSETALGIGSRDYIRNVLVNAVGEDKATGLMDKILNGNDTTSGLEKLKWLDGRTIAESISEEHPQIIAILIAYLDAEQSAEVLEWLPEPVQADVVMRIASLDGIPPAALQELNMVMEKQFNGKTGLRTAGVGGIKVAAKILNNLHGGNDGRVLQHIRQIDENMGVQIENLMFVFDDLLAIPDRDMQGLLREVSTDILLIAMKGSSERFREKVFKNMSTRAAEMLRDDLEAKGAVKLSEVESAQKEILDTARKMADAGTITIGGKSNGVIV